MKTSNKLKNTREVVFKEAYKIGNGRVIYEKGSKHFIHHKTVEQLRKYGAKMDVKKYAAEEKIEQAKIKFENAKDKGDK